MYGKIHYNKKKKKKMSLKKKKKNVILLILYSMQPFYTDFFHLTMWNNI